jgi:capsular exopolysaccharide synthesis family protein
MTTIPTTRPAVPAAPGRAGHAATAGAPVIDPLKLLKKHKWVLMGAAAAGALLGLIAHVVLMQVAPIYSPFTLYECMPLQSSISDNTPAVTSKDELEKFMATQVAMVTSDKIIDQTLTNPAFTTEAPRWSRPYLDRNGALNITEASRAVKRRLGASVIGESTLIRVSFWGTDRDEATAILRLIGQAYERDRRDINSNMVNERLGRLQANVDETDGAIRKRQADRETLLQNQSVDSLEQANSSVSDEIKNLNETLLGLRANIESLGSRRQSMEEELARPGGITISDDIRQRTEEDPSLVRVKDMVNAIAAELAASRKMYGPDHRVIKQLENRLEAQNLVLATERVRLQKQYFDSTLEGIRSQIASLQASESELLKKLEKAKLRAAELTQTLAKVKDIEQDITRLTATKGELAESAKKFIILNPSTLSRIVRVQDAQPPRAVSFPKLSVMLALGIFIVLGAVTGLVVFLEVIDQRVKGAADIAMIPRTRILGVVPHAAEDPAAPQKIETVFRDQPGGVMAESYRQLRATVIKRMQEREGKTLLVLSGMAGSGATSVICNLAFALASANVKVLVIDANLRRPSVHRVLGLAETPGLADVMEGKETLASAAKQTENPRVHVLPAGTASLRIVERLATHPMGEVLRQASDAYDIVLIDVAPAQIAGDALALAQRCDASMLVVRAFGEKRGMVARLRNELGEARAEFLGVVVNAARSLAGGYLKGNILAAHQYQNGKE